MRRAAASAGAGVCGDFEPSCARASDCSTASQSVEALDAPVETTSSRASARADAACGHVNLLGALRCFASTSDAAGKHFRKAAGNRDVNGLRALSIAQRADAQFGQQRRVARQDAEIALAARHLHLGHRFANHFAFRRDHFKRKVSDAISVSEFDAGLSKSVRAPDLARLRSRYAAVAAIFSAFSRTSSMVPTM